MMVRDSDLAPQLARLLVDDLTISARQSGKEVWTEAELDELVAKAALLCRSRRLVYTAFDGDHQQLSALMRRCVLADGCVPVNPDSVLDYRETVVGRQTKRGVLLDDLSILRGCDELWVFTDQPASPSGLAGLAEGVLVELLYFLKRKPGASVYFLSVRSLITGGNVERTTLDLGYEEAKKAIPADSVSGVLGLANSGLKTDRELPSPIFYIIDPMDFKYARFILPRAYQKGTSRELFVPLVPYLAVPLGDNQNGLLGLGEVVLSWIKLSELASQCVLLPSIDQPRSKSGIWALLNATWLRQRGGPIAEESWRGYGVPKANQGSLWPITDRERAVISGMV